MELTLRIPSDFVGTIIIEAVGKDDKGDVVDEINTVKLIDLKNHFGINTPFSAESACIHESETNEEVTTGAIRSYGKFLSDCADKVFELGDGTWVTLKKIPRKNGKDIALYLFEWV